jgi:hypothetical protein
MNQDNKKAVIPAKAGIQMKKNFPRSGATPWVSATRSVCFNWIPAFAGMTA